MTDLAPNVVVDDRYVLVSRVGAGGMAEVWCAEDRQLGRRVALKLLHERFARDAQFVERFRREASAAAGLQHPNVVAVYDRGEWAGRGYISMEFVEGRTLKQLIRDEAPLSPRRAVDLTIQILKAVRFAHQRGIVHRDLKPQNVIVDHEGRAKVTDFGIARAGASDMTETGSILGTAQYLSPEQAQGHAVSGQSDLYAVGIVLWEMLTGQVPFDADQPVAVALRHVSEPAPPPSALNPGVPPALDAVVLHALAKDPADRYPDADAFIADLERALEGLAPVHGTETIAVVDDERRTPWGWIALGLLALLAAAAAAFFLLQPDKLTVPNVVGKDEEAATTILENEGFRVDVQRVTSDSPEGQVIRQTPQPGEKAEENSVVTIRVSGGPGTVEVPPVEGLTEKSAVRRLDRKGLEAEVQDEFSDTVAKGRVIRSSPDAGTEVEVGSTVRLFVSKGREEVEVPDVAGKQRDEAERELEDAGFRVTVTEEESETEDPGTVLRQDPAAGSRAPKGSTVALVVAKEPEQVEVPDVTGQEEADAVDALQQAGLRVDLETQEVDDPDQDGIVVEQDPRGGRKVDRGSRVTVVVGEFVPPDIPPEDGSPTP